MAKVEIDQEWVLSRLALVVERCLQNLPVRDRRGNPVVIETSLLGKDVGLFTDKTAGATQLSFETSQGQLAAAYEALPGAMQLL